MPTRSRSAALIAAVLLGALAACEDTPVPMADGGVGRRLEILDPPGSQIGLRFSRSQALAVRYLIDDASARPLRNEPVRFAIFDDPVGSTLSQDSVLTDDEGLAMVALNGGTQEGSFHVRVTAAGATDVEFAISISELEFVDIDAEIIDPLPESGGRTLVAALFTDRPCAALGPSPTMIGASRTLVRPAADRATFSFVNLLSRTSAVVGRVEDAGKLVAYGCLDVDRALAPPGASLRLPIPMSDVQPTVVGSYEIVTSLSSARDGRADGLLADYDVVDRCEGHLAQLLLDELISRLPMARASLAASQRAPTVVSTVGQSSIACRPAKLGATDTLDAELHALVGTGSNGGKRAELWGDLDELLESATMSSRLRISSTAPQLGDGADAPESLLVDHEVRTITLALGSMTRVYDLAALGRPTYGVSGIGALRSAAQLTIYAHTLPLGIPELWGTAWGELSIAPRLPALAEPTVSGWVRAAAAEAQRSAKAGCAAIEDLVCERTGGQAGCTGTLLTPCAQAIDAVATRLAVPLSIAAPWPGAASLGLQGSAIIVDDDADLVGNRLDEGTWVASGTLSQGLAFAGQRSTP